MIEKLDIVLTGIDKPITLSIVHSLDKLDLEMLLKFWSRQTKEYNSEDFAKYVRNVRPGIIIFAASNEEATRELVLASKN